MKKNIYQALSLFVIGSGIYATCRQNVIFLIPLKNTKLLEWIKIDIHYHSGNIFTYFFLFCLPDALWYLALLLIQIQFHSQSTIGKFLFYFSVVLPFILEFMQYFGVLLGTFDIVDVSFYLLTLLIFMIWKKEILF